MATVKYYKDKKDFVICKRTYVDGEGKIRYSKNIRYSFYIDNCNDGEYYHVEYPLLHDDDNKKGVIVSIGFLKPKFNQHFMDYKIFERKIKIEKINGIKYN
jgi:hypothetical protein